MELPLPHSPRSVLVLCLDAVDALAAKGGGSDGHLTLAGVDKMMRQLSGGAWTTAPKRLGVRFIDACCDAVLVRGAARAGCSAHAHSSQGCQGLWCVHGSCTVPACLCRTCERLVWRGSAWCGAGSSGGGCRCPQSSSSRRRRNRRCSRRHRRSSSGGSGSSRHLKQWGWYHRPCGLSRRSRKAPSACRQSECCGRKCLAGGGSACPLAAGLADLGFAQPSLPQDACAVPGGHRCLAGRWLGIGCAHGPSADNDESAVRGTLGAPQTAAHEIPRRLLPGCPGAQARPAVLPPDCLHGARGPCMVLAGLPRLVDRAPVPLCMWA